MTLVGRNKPASNAGGKCCWAHLCSEFCTTADCGPDCALPFTRPLTWRRWQTVWAQCGRREAWRGRQVGRPNLKDIYNAYASYYFMHYAPIKWLSMSVCYHYCQLNEGSFIIIIIIITLTEQMHFLLALMEVRLIPSPTSELSSHSPLAGLPRPTYQQTVPGACQLSWMKKYFLCVAKHLQSTTCSGRETFTVIIPPWLNTLCIWVKVSTSLLVVVATPCG